MDPRARRAHAEAARRGSSRYGDRVRARARRALVLLRRQRRMDAHHAGGPRRRHGCQDRAPRGRGSADGAHVRGAAQQLGRRPRLRDPVPLGPPVQPARFRPRGRGRAAVSRRVDQLGLHLRFQRSRRGRLSALRRRVRHRAAVRHAGQWPRADRLDAQIRSVSRAGRRVRRVRRGRTDRDRLEPARSLRARPRVASRRRRDGLAVHAVRLSTESAGRGPRASPTRARSRAASTSSRAARATRRWCSR